MVIFNSVCLVLLVKAVLKMREISKKYSSLKEIYLAMALYITSFSLTIVLTATWLSFYAAYIRRDEEDPNLYSQSTNFHLAGLISSVMLNVFISFVAVKLSERSLDEDDELFGRKVSIIVKIRTDEALS